MSFVGLLMRVIVVDLDSKIAVQERIKFLIYKKITHGPNAMVIPEEQEVMKFGLKTIIFIRALRLSAKS